MSRSTLVILIVASSLTVLGIAIGLVGLHVNQNRLYPEIEFKETTHDVEENIESISVNVHTADITLIATDDQKAQVVCKGETEKLKYSVEVKDGTLCVGVIDTRAWYDHIVIFSPERSVSIFLPRDVYASLAVNTNTGDVHIPNDLSFESARIECDTGDVSWNTDVFGELRINTDTGDVYINDSNCKTVEINTDTGRIKLNATHVDENVNIKSSTGNVILHGVLTDGNMKVTTSTGDVLLDRCDASELSITTSTGNVEGSLLTDKIFVCETSTGDVRVPSTTTGGICNIKTSTGDIDIIINK